MDLFKIEWKNSAEKDLKKIERKYISKILSSVEILGKNPFKVKFKKLQGCEKSYRIRIGEYRVYIKLI